jgi:hypothetical protein
MYTISDATTSGINKEDATMIFNNVTVKLPKQQLVLYPGKQYKDNTRQWLIQLAHPTANTFITISKIRGTRDNAEQELRKFIIE